MASGWPGLVVLGLSTPEEASFHVVATSPPTQSFSWQNPPSCQLCDLMLPPATLKEDLGRRLLGHFRMEVATKR